MVYYFTSSVVQPSAFIYVGKDKFENEDLIKYGLEKDVWYSYLIHPPPSLFELTLIQEAQLAGFVCEIFHEMKSPTTSSGPNTPSQFHVDNLSSAHVYVRLRDGETWDKIPEQLLIDCAQLTKANSIEGNKKDNITVIYTPWSNLMKDGSMAAGQVSFHNQKLVKKVFVAERENAIVNRLNKTRVEKFPDLRAEKEEYVKVQQREERKGREERKNREKQEKREREQLKWQKDHAYDDLFSEENMEASNNQDRGEDFLDDFM